MASLCGMNVGGGRIGVENGDGEAAPRWPGEVIPGGKGELVAGKKGGANGGRNPAGKL